MDKDFYNNSTFCVMLVQKAHGDPFIQLCESEAI